MKTVITRKIDGFDIIVGFGTRAVDPVETRKVVDIEIKKTDEFLAVEEKRKPMNESRGNAQQSSMKSSHASGKLKDDHYSDFLAHDRVSKGIEKEVRALLPAMKQKRQDLMSEMAVYFEPKAGEIVKTDAEIQALLDVLGSVAGVSVVDIGGNVIEDNRGVVHCAVSGDGWAIGKINTLGVGVPVDAVLYDDLSIVQKKAVDLQIEKDNAGMMTLSEKHNSRVAAEGMALNDAESMRSRLEIQSVEDALEQSKEFYQARMSEIEVIYG